MRLIGLFIAIALAATAGFAVLKFTGDKDKSSDVSVVVDPKAPQAQVATVDVLVAKEQIPIGTILTADMYDRQPWPANLVLQQFIVAGDKDPGIVGMVSRSPFQAREPLIMTKLANPNDPSFLAAALPEGMRAVTIATDAVAGVAGFVFPGDRVDILYTHEKPLSEQDKKDRKTGRASGRPEMITEVLASNLKVMAVDQRSTSATGDKIPLPTNVSLEVSQEDAQRLRLSERSGTGTLSLALRSLKDIDSKDMVVPSVQTDLTRFVTEDSGAQPSSSIFIVRGVHVEEFETDSAESTPPPAPSASGGQ